MTNGKAEIKMSQKFVLTYNQAYNKQFYDLDFVEKSLKGLFTRLNFQRQTQIQTSRNIVNENSSVNAKLFAENFRGNETELLRRLSTNFANI